MSTQKTLSVAIQELATVKDIPALRGKRGARQRRINKIRSYLSTTDSLSLAHISLSETERMRECLEYETSLNKATQDRIFELMELQDLNTEAEEKEDEESLAEHSQLRIQIASVESAVRARILGREIRDEIDSLAERETLHGRFVKGQLELSQLYALWDGAENSEEVKTLVHELKADFTTLNRRFADEEPDTGSDSTLSDKSITITRDAVRLPHLEQPSSLRKVKLSYQLPPSMETVMGTWYSSYDRYTIDNAIATDYTFNSCSSTPSVSTMKISTVP